jgi:citrate synthase
MDGPIGTFEPFELPPVPPIDPGQLLKWAVLMSEEAATLVSDMRRCVIATTAGRLLGTMVQVLETGQRSSAPILRLDDGREVSDSLAGRLAVTWAGARADEGLVRAINAALILLADQALSIETLAVRVAASGRSNVYNAVLVGLSSLSSPERPCTLSFELMLDAERRGVDRAAEELLRRHGMVPGFCRPHVGGDSRFDVLQGFVERVSNPERVALVRSILDFANAHHLPAPCVEFGVAGIMFAAGMPRHSGQVIRAIASSAGWIAHYLEELEEPQLVLR